MSRKDNTLKFTPVDEDGEAGTPKYLPVETVKALYCFGSLDANSALYNFLGKQGIGVHFFDYYEHYTGSFAPKEYLQAGKVHIAQAMHYTRHGPRMALARELIEGASFNMLKNLRYYDNRGKDLSFAIERIEALRAGIPEAPSIQELMGVEGNIRQAYYQGFDLILDHFRMNGRSKRPPANEVNALMSFGNMVCYAHCLDMLYHTQLNPTVSFLHEPGTRRFSLALDLAEIFKPILVDRLLFRLLNAKMIKAKDFDAKVNSCLLKESGRKIFARAWDEKLKETIQHRKLKKKVSYGHLVKLECYKLSKHILDIEPYSPFKAWW
ncbi:CRISPR-associated endonuclease Cas1 (plasmid) [Fulvitalea axinellae]|uniref:CRISPR-associated endonuclease Cas1 n=2 Tax=Fulvitalea axinellae TaxID=1182444 RepID=A0AAU9DFK1_9BACT|nr:CRISPR-associated endonuclease Cas1 [Fulvitalea axinellae]